MYLRLAGALEGEWFTTMRLRSLKRAHIDDLFADFYCVFWLKYLLLCEQMLSERASSTRQGERDSTWRYGWMLTWRCVRNEAASEREGKRKNLLSMECCGVRHQLDESLVSERMTHALNGLANKVSFMIAGQMSEPLVRRLIDGIYFTAELLVLFLSFFCSCHFSFYDVSLFV